MSIGKRIESDLRAAMKARERVRTETLRLLRAALKEREIAARGEGEVMTPEDEVKVMMSAAKKRKESIEFYRQGNRSDLVDREEEELKIIGEYLSKMLSEREVENEVRIVLSAHETVTASDFGRVMQSAMKSLKGKADGKLVQQVVRRMIEEKEKERKE